MVFRSCLWALLQRCPGCSKPCHAEIAHRSGSMIKVNRDCDYCEDTNSWTSQPMLGEIPAGNILLSSAIMFTGASYTKTLRVLNSMNIATISTRTFQDHCKKFLHPAIYHMFLDSQSDILRELRSMDGGLVLGGDGRADSPGYSAKYGSYTLIELRTKKVVHMQLVQVSCSVQWCIANFETAVVLLSYLYMSYHIYWATFCS